MSLPAERLTEAQAQQGLGLSIWWRPAKVALYDRGWRTLHYPDYTLFLATAKGRRSKAISPSPIGVDGKVYYIGFDIDTGPEAVRKLLSALPPNCVPLVSRSGGRNGNGYHVWLFPSEPLEVQTAVSFAKVVREKAGVLCEIRPTSRRSLCLKWPGQRHPESGLQEVFVPLDDLNDTERLDTPVILQMLTEGCYRTPIEVVEGFVEAHCSKKPKTKKQATAKARPAQRVEGHWLEVFKDEQAGFRLLELFGKHVRVSRLGRAFKCPVHNERRPSATFIRDSNGLIAFHDWHFEKYGLESEFFTLPELYHALKTKSELHRLDRREQAATAKELAFLLGFTNPLVEEISSKWLESTRILLKLGVITDLIFKRLVTTPTPKDWLKALNLNGLSDFERVWVMCFWCFIQDAMDGKAVTVMSKRFLGDKAGVKYWAVNRILNLLCSLGLLEKCEVVKHGKRLGADRYRLCRVNEAEAKRRFDLLFPEGKFNLRQFKASLVAERLGEETAKAIFRRQGGKVSEDHSKDIQIPSEGLGISSEDIGISLEDIQAIEAAIKRLAEEIGRLEEAGDVSRVNDLVRQAVALGRRRLALLKRGDYTAKIAV
ncbi:MAG: hypothetical protein L5656_04535 [Thermanaeromonas sp.]|uniref:hypothetical protein n=1 Tax=Thermanaeromonas sp. TaxID=2003697 RepID=UPI0024402E03|nr:hypothetical protein [Thermanaeromonas sp.]MCG0277781.1 hypothetical protein [Thermanaeromonas sp.]